MSKRTGYAWLAAGIFLLVYEILTLVFHWQTLSGWMWAAANYPLIPFAAGVLCGHFFWQRKTPAA
jgi:hypothetical protein